MPSHLLVLSTFYLYLADQKRIRIDGCKKSKTSKSGNKAFLKVKAQRTEIELFKKNLIALLDTINETESEEFHKNIVSKFLTDIYYNSKHYINTKG